jgi:hypothetical protein
LINITIENTDRSKGTIVNEEISGTEGFALGIVGVRVEEGIGLGVDDFVGVMVGFKLGSGLVDTEKITLKWAATKPPYG